MSGQNQVIAPRASLILPVIFGVMLFAGFVVLGTWQIKRLYWKQALIERVEQRVHAPAINAPENEQWNMITAESDEYRHVKVSGIFLEDLSTQVVASTILGRGFWVMTPLRLTNGSIIFINRGFIPYGSTLCTSKLEMNEVTGLLRIDESGGSFLRINNPNSQQWYSRDVTAMATNKHLSNVAPFFIDAEAKKNANESERNSIEDCTTPVAGLTIISFPNNHLVYAITWYALAFMIVGAYFIVRRASPDHS